MEPRNQQKVVIVSDSESNFSGLLNENRLFTYDLIKTESFKKINAPGQLKLHYSPGIPVQMNKKSIAKNQALIGFGKNFKIGGNYFNLSKKGDLNEVANKLYTTMRKIKKNKFKSIYITKIPNIGVGHAINDRLKKASNK